MHYSAPEICRGSLYVGPEVDVWSLGVVLYALNASKLPFRGVTSRKVLKRILVAAPDYPEDFSNDLVSLLCAMLNPDRALRARIEHIHTSPYLANPSTPQCADRAHDREEDREVRAAS